MVDIEICDSLESIKNLKPEWDYLSNEIKNKNIFLSYQWIYNWFKTGHGSLKPFLITGRDNSKLVTILPFSAKSGTIYPAGYPESDFIDVIGISGYENSFLEKVFAFFSNNTANWDIAFIKTVTEHSYLCNYFLRNRKTLNTIAEIIPFSKCFIAEFNKGWNDYLNGMSAKFRSNLRRREKIAMESGDVSHVIYNAGEIDEKLFSQIVSINLSGRKADKKNAFFQTQSHISFFSELIIAESTPEIFFALLFIGDTAVAYKICFRADNEVWEYNTSFREEYHRSSPGLLLTAKVIQELAERKVNKYNFLKGDEPYKSNFANYSENLYILTLRNKRLKSSIKYLADIKLRMFLNRFDALRNIYDRLTG